MTARWCEASPRCGRTSTRGPAAPWTLPLAGLAVWSAAGVAGIWLPTTQAIYLLVFATGAIFPLALLFARLLGESLLGNTNPLARLMAMAVLMVNLLWGVHLTVLATRPEYLPLTLAIGLGLHWVVFSWIIRHPVGVAHAVARTIHALEGAATAGARLVMVDNLYAYGSPGVPITEATPQAATSRKGRIRRDVGQRLLAAHGPTATTPHAEAVARTVAHFRAANASP